MAREPETGELSDVLPKQRFGPYRRALPWAWQLADDASYVRLYNRDLYPMLTRYRDGTIVKGGAYGGWYKYLAEDDDEFNSLPIERLEAVVEEFLDDDGLFAEAVKP